LGIFGRSDVSVVRAPPLISERAEARDLTVSGEKHRIKQRFYPVEVTAR
jgi:hypothetical protein